MALDFEYQTNPSQIVFGSGAVAKVADAARRQGCERLLVLTTEAQSDAGETLACQLGPLCLGVYSKARMHTPVSVTAWLTRSCFST